MIGFTKLTAEAILRFKQKRSIMLKFSDNPLERLKKNPAYGKDYAN